MRQFLRLVVSGQLVSIPLLYWFGVVEPFTPNQPFEAWRTLTGATVWPLVLTMVVGLLSLIGGFLNVPRRLDALSLFLVMAWWLTYSITSVALTPGPPINGVGYAALTTYLYLVEVD